MSVSLSCSKINSLSKLRDIKVMGGTRCPKHYREQEMLLVFLLCKMNRISKNEKLFPSWSGRAVQNNGKDSECLVGLSAL
jgi:hypothetical protein